jgi:3-dehydroquinate synthase
MKTIAVKLAKRSYQIAIGFGVINKLGKYIQHLKLGEDAFIITNSLIKRRYGRIISSSLNNYVRNFSFKIIADSEKSKSLSNSLGIIQDLARFNQQGRVFVVAFGGGVVGDVGGFVASVYKRGIPYIQAPTTLLACVDSSIGGKTGVDLRFGKNLVGTFYQPRLVLSELSFLKTLSLRQVRAGLAEVIKYAIIKDKDLFGYLEKNYSRLLNLDNSALESVVNICAQIKARIIQQDERENKGLRTILNFGHTLGHAIEAAGDYRKYNHGEAIALGMVLASQLSSRVKLIDLRIVRRIENLIKVVGLPTAIKGLSKKRIIEAYYRDKKFTGARNRFVLIKDIGRTIIKQDLPLNIIKESLNERMNLQT